MRIVIETIPHAQQRYPTVGDWCIDPDGTWRIYVSELPEKNALLPQKFALLVAFHELVEMMLCQTHGITPTQVDAFDMNWARTSPWIKEPGDDPTAPYFKEHQTASLFERFLSAVLEVDWDEYSAAVDSL
jgi:hypothetical protein